MNGGGVGVEPMSSSILVMAVISTDFRFCARQNRLRVELRQLVRQLDMRRGTHPNWRNWRSQLYAAAGSWRFAPVLRQLDVFFWGNWRK